MVRLRSPGVNLNGVPQSCKKSEWRILYAGVGSKLEDHLTYYQELDPLVFDNLEVYCRTEVAYIDPTSSSLYRVLRPVMEF